VKLSSSVFAILLLLSSIELEASRGAVQAFIYNANSYRTLENDLTYSYAPSRNSEISVTTATSRQQWLSFDTGAANGKLGFGYTYSKQAFRHKLLSGFEFHSDNSIVTDTSADYRSRVGYLGYEVGISTPDSIYLNVGGTGYLRKEKDQFAPDSNLDSQGWGLSSSAGYNAEFGFGSLSADAYYLHKDLDWEYFDEGNVDAMFDYRSNSLSANTQLTINDRLDKLYTLVQNSLPLTGGTYQKTDTQKRWSLNWNSSVALLSLPNASLDLRNAYSQRKTTLNTNITRNNADYQNQADLAFGWTLLERLALKTSIGHSYAVKEFSYTNSTRRTELRSLGSTLTYVYGNADSLVTGAAVDLQRTVYPDSFNRLDNDLRHVNLRLGWKHYYKDRIRLNTILLWTITDDVYIDSLLSGNNNRVNSVLLSPECQIVLGDKVLFRQYYQLRADYTDYSFDTTAHTDGLYRQFAGKLSLIYDSYPALARQGDLRWLSLPFRAVTGSSLLLDLSVGYERSEYGDKQDEIYVINSLTEKYSASVSLRRDIPSLYYTLQPKYSWGSWREYSLLLGVAWKFNGASSLELSLAPYGETLSSLDWRTTASLNMRF